SQNNQHLAFGYVSPAIGQNVVKCSNMTETEGSEFRRHNYPAFSFNAVAIRETCQIGHQCSCSIRICCSQCWKIGRLPWRGRRCIGHLTVPEIGVCPWPMLHFCIPKPGMIKLPGGQCHRACGSGALWVGRSTGRKFAGSLERARVTAIATRPALRRSTPGRKREEKRRAATDS